MGDRCTGHCCRDFTLSFSPDQVAPFPTLTDEGGNELRDENGRVRVANDGEQIRDMLIPLGRYKFARQVAAAHITRVEAEEAQPKAAKA